MDYKKGSEWGRWDLHIHTPETKKNDCYTGRTPDEKWDNYYNDINSYVSDGTDLNKHIVAIGITDYLSVDNYIKVVNDHRLPASIKLILPNVEMRCRPIAKDSPINIHFIFNPDIVDSLESRFFSKLSMSFATTDYSAAKDELIRLGKKSDDQLDDIAAYRKGIELFVPELSTIKKVFENDQELRNNTLIFVSNSTGDGVSGAANHSDYITEDKSSQLTAFRQDIYNFVDGIFSAKPSDIKYFSGANEKIPPEKVIKECGGLKPCIHGSDAHCNDKIFEPDGKKYCWIKANPTFNGLKQIIYEPVERVKISPILPEEKMPYNVIDHIIINDDDFQKDAIYFNDKLTCIIGGKSTGKTLLLHNLAKAIDEKQVSEKEKDLSRNTKEITNIKVFWNDGETADKRKIVYIPQTYLNRLSDDKQNTNEIDNIIQEIVLLNEDSKNTYQTVLDSVKSYKSELNKKILDLLSINSKIVSLINEKKEIGDAKGISDVISVLTVQKELLSSELNISQTDFENYEKSIQIIQNSDKELLLLQGNLSFIQALDTIVELKNFTVNLSPDINNLFIEAQKSVLNNANLEWVSWKTKLLAVLDEKIKTTLSLKQNAEKEKAKLEPKIKSSEALADITQKIANETSNKEKVEEFDAEITKEKALYYDVKKQILDSIEKFKIIYQTYADIVNENIKSEKEDIDFVVTVPFRKNDFIAKIRSVFHNNSKELKAIINLDEFNDSDYTKELMVQMVDKIIDGSLALKNGYNVESALREIFDDWYNIKYNVRMGEDSIDVMSPGKKALVLLKLLIDMAESKCPILIDQPEDDLDNRSVFDDLIPFIKKKKKDRQIIVVTHNANVVLGADADEIIVANQNGNNCPNKEYRFEYRTGAIEEDKPIIKDDGAIEDGILNKQGIQQHICDILEGGERAFELRKHKYHI